MTFYSEKGVFGSDFARFDPDFGQFDSDFGQFGAVIYKILIEKAADFTKSGRSGHQLPRAQSLLSSGAHDPHQER